MVDKAGFPQHYRPILVFAAIAFQTRIRVRYQETDVMGVVYYANYLTWFEVARTEYMRSVGK